MAKKKTEQEQKKYKIIREKLRFKAQTSPTYDEEFWEQVRKHIEEAE